MSGALAPRPFEGEIPTIATLPDVPPELQVLFDIQNRDLTVAHWGAALGLWKMLAFFPMPTNTVRKNLHLGRRQFWTIVDKLADRRVIWLRYGRKSHFFQVFFCSSALEAHEGRSSALEAHVRSSAPRADEGVLIGSRGRRARLIGVKSPVVAVDFNNPSTTAHTPTEADLERILAGAPMEWLSRIKPGIRLGRLIPHYQEAAVQAPGDPAGRLVGAIYYLADRFLEGEKFRNVLAALRVHVREGHCLASPPTEVKKGPSNAKPESPAYLAATERDHEREHRDLLNKYADRSFEEVVTEITNHPLWPGRKKTLLANFEALLKKNPNLNAFKAWAAQEAEK